MVFRIKFNEEKNQLLKATRGISFDDVQDAIEKDDIIDDIFHPSKRYPRQKMFVVSIKGYAYAVPYVVNTKKQEIFLKTIYPSRRLTKLYLKGGKNEKKEKI